MTADQEIELLKDAMYVICGVLSSMELRPKPGETGNLISYLSQLLVAAQKLRDDEAEQKGGGAMQAGIEIGRLRVGDVFQVNERHPQPGWVGAFVTATEMKGFGIQGFVHIVQSSIRSGQAYIRLGWDEMDYIGHAALMPGDVDDEETQAKA